ncbi:MAG: molybdopterin-dependent oxidoreductase [Byssovorax sp.]
MIELTTMETIMAGASKPTACILCSINCGLEATPEAGHLTKIRGDRAHPGSRGYTCEKALRLDCYQNGKDRLRAPLRRRPDGSFEEIDWDTAIREVASALGRVKAQHGGESIFYYGGGGQGNHLGGAYARATRAALGSVFTSNALAQEKTGEFWVDGQLFGRPRCHTSGDFEHAEVAVFAGKNPWQSHGFPRARAVLKAIAKDPGRALVVIDPRRSETAEMADYHLQIRPGADALCLSALLAVLVQEDLVDHAFVRERCKGGEQIFAELARVSVASHAARAGVPEALVREVGRRIARAKSVSIFEDLGMQQAPHSTLGSYLEKLVYLLTGNFGKRGAMNIHSRMASLGGGAREGTRTSPVGGHRIITGLIPCNVIPDEILTDHPKRFRAMIVESANPAHSLADSRRMREALASLECLVTIDVALSETARLSHYVLPAASQFEKWEASFFNLEFPDNVFQLRAPLLDPLPGTLPEAEIHRRLCRALGAYGDADLAPLVEAASRIPAEGRGPFAAAFFQLTATRPDLFPLAPVLLYEALGPALPEGASTTAALWGVAHLCALAHAGSLKRAGFTGDGPALGEALFDAMLEKRSGFVFSRDDYPETWSRLDTPDKKIRLDVPELIPALARLIDEPETPRDPAFPFILSAGERRSSTANTIFRDPAWRQKDTEGALRLSVEDAARLGIAEGGKARITTRRGSMVASVEITDMMQPGHVSLPNGLGLSYPDEAGAPVTHGVAPNELTASEDRDFLAGTPFHKHVPARVEPA